jgi:DNA polymerase V
MLRLKRHATKRDVLGFRLPMLTHEEPILDIADITYKCTPYELVILK